MKLFRVGGLLAGLTAGLLAAVPLYAATAPAPAYKLGEVVVSAPKTGAESVSTVRVVTAQQIKDRGARTLADALELVPGIHVRTANDGTPRIDIRGFRTRNIKLLLNGIPINSALDGQFDPAEIPVENIAEIKVTTSGASELYGQGGNAGVINIITKAGTPGVRGTVTGEAAQADRYIGRFTLSGGSGDVTGFLSGSTYQRHAFRLSNDYTPTAEQAGGHRDNSDRENNNLFLNLNFSPTKKTSVGVTVGYNQGDYGIPPVVNFDKNDPFSKKAKYERIDNIHGLISQVAFSHDFDGPLSVRGWAYFNREEKEDNLYDDATYTTQDKKGSGSSNDITQIAGANVQLKYDLHRAGAATLGLMGESDNWAGNGFTVKQPKNGGAAQRASFDDHKAVQIYTVALQYVVNPLPKLGVVLGFGQHFHQAPENDESSYSYLVGLHYDILPGTRIKFVHSRKIRFPSIQRLYDITSGNPNLRAEWTLHYELGIEQTLPADTWVSLTGYRSDAHDFIEKNDAVNQYQNFQHYRFQGFEVTAENHYVKHLALRASYTYLDAKNLSDGSALNQLQYRPRDTVMLEGRYNFNFGLMVDANLLYVGNQVYLNKNSTESRALNDYTVVNLKLSQDLLNHRLNVYAGADNLLDKNYEEAYGIPQAGRTIYGGVEYRF